MNRGFVNNVAGISGVGYRNGGPGSSVYDPDEVIYQEDFVTDEDESDEDDDDDEDVEGGSSSTVYGAGAALSLPPGPRTKALQDIRHKLEHNFFSRSELEDKLQIFETLNDSLRPEQGRTNAFI